MGTAGLQLQSVTQPPEPLTHRQVLVVFSGLLMVMLLAALDSTLVSASRASPAHCSADSSRRISPGAGSSTSTFRLVSPHFWCSPPRFQRDQSAECTPSTTRARYCSPSS